MIRTVDMNGLSVQVERVYKWRECGRVGEERVWEGGGRQSVGGRTECEREEIVWEGVESVGGRLECGGRCVCGRVEGGGR
jgi:hypothetical protein